jgi:hypothetical protein
VCSTLIVISYVRHFILWLSLVGHPITMGKQPTYFLQSNHEIVVNCQPFQLAEHSSNEQPTIHNATTPRSVVVISLSLLLSLSHRQANHR